MLQRLERVGLLATRALSVAGLIALMVLAVMTLFDGLARWLANQPIEGVRDVGGLAIALAVSCCIPVGLMERSNITIRIFESVAGRFAGKLLDALAAVLVAIVVGVVGYALQAGWAPAFTILASEPSGQLASVDLATVALFLLMGTFASAAGFSSDIYSAAASFLGHRRGGLYSGIFTVNEAASAAAVLSLVFAIARGRMNWASAWTGLRESASSTSPPSASSSRCCWPTSCWVPCSTRSPRC